MKLGCNASAALVCALALALLGFCNAGIFGKPLLEAGASRKGTLGSQDRENLSLRLRRSSRSKLPAWCKTDRKYGAYHTLSDDEYTDESPFLRCAFPDPRSPHRRGNTQGDNSQPECSEVLAIPKVALLFITRGVLPHEQLWEKWLGSIEGKIPRLCAANAVCARGGYDALQEIATACSLANKTGNAYSRQFLFSAYAHTPPDVPRFGRKSVFYGRDSLTPRYSTAWGDHSTVEVMRSLLAAALQDPNNHRFVTFSESCVPIHSALVVYQQLMYETRSRVSACSQDHGRMHYTNPERYNLRMGKGNDSAGRVHQHQWRKHWQFFTLIRSHAEVVSNDTQVVNTFAKDCFSAFDPLTPDPANAWRFCVSDEHYVSTLLAVRELESETDCIGEVTFADWSGLDANHPISFSSDTITPDLIQRMRGPGIQGKLALILTTRAFSSVQYLTANDSAWYIPYPYIRQLRSHSHLFARKFPAETAQPLLQMYGRHDIKGFLFGIFNGRYESEQEGGASASVTDQKGYLPGDLNYGSDIREPWMIDNFEPETEKLEQSAEVTSESGAIESNEAAENVLEQPVTLNTLLDLERKQSEIAAKQST